MSEPTRYPLPGTEHLVERLPAPPAGARARRWVLRDDNGQHYHGVVPLAESPAVLELLWKAAADAPEHPVGVYRLHLPELLAADHVRFDREGEPGGGVRVRFYRARAASSSSNGAPTARRSPSGRSARRPARVAACPPNVALQATRYAGPGQRTRGLHHTRPSSRPYNRAPELGR